MNRRRYTLIAISLMLAVIAGLLWLPGGHLKERLNKSVPGLGTVSSWLGSPKAAFAPGTSSTQEARFLSSYLARIDLYGKVVDQNSNPIPDAEVIYSVNDHPVWNEQPSPSRVTRTDGGGMFALIGLHGLSLGVEVKKSGFHQLPLIVDKITSHGVFFFGLGHPPLSSRESPLIFHLQKAGVLEPLEKFGQKSFHFKPDGTPVEISLDQSNDPISHHVVLRCWCKSLDPRPQGQWKYDWRLEIFIPSGGLIIRSDALDFIAPEDGYMASDIIDMPAAGKRWNSDASRSYFLKFNDGMFGRANIEMQTGGDCFAIWESCVNPKNGSRNLETGPNGR